MIKSGSVSRNMQNTNKARSKDSKAKACCLCGQENVGHTLTLLEQDVLQMLVSSNDAMKAPKSCVDQITACGCWGVEPHFRSDMWHHVLLCILYLFMISF